jgi:thymidine kinase
MVVRKDDSGKVVTEGSKVVVGGNDIYMPVCRKHYRKLTKLI